MVFMGKSRIPISGLLLLQVVVGCGSVDQIPAEPIPVENFIKNPTKSSFQLNPDGSRYAYLASHDGLQRIFVVDLASDQPTCLTPNLDSDVRDYLWMDSGTLLYQQTASEDGCAKIYRVSTDQSEPVCLTRKNNLNFRLVRSSGGRSKGVLIAVSGVGDRGWEPHWLDWQSGAAERVARNPGNVSEWLLDHEGEGIIAVSEEGCDTHILYRSAGEDEFQRVLSYDNVHDYFRPVWFTPDNTSVYAYSNLGRDTIALVEYELSTNVESRVLFHDSDYDLFGDDEVDRVGYSLKSNRLAYAFYTSWRRTYHFFDDHYRDVVTHLVGRFDNYVIRLVSANETEDRHIVKISSDRLRGVYYLFDESTGEIRMLEDIYPWLDEASMASKQPISFTSRDGRVIHGYLTRPRGARPEGLPLVVVPHGGPRWRNYWEMDRFTEVQLFANRGYAVLNVNFRGSSGYGKKFLAAGFKKNGLDVQNDITDGVRFLIEKRIVDKDRIAIVGGSYGGYAVLAGLAFTPDLYACGVDLFGVSNFFTFLESLPPWINREALYRTIGHPEHDRDLLTRTSPLFHVDSIEAPLLIAQGGQDPIVNKAESEQMVAALRDRNMNVEYIYKEDEGHGYFRDEQNWRELWEAVDLFLANHLKDIDEPVVPQ